MPYIENNNIGYRCADMQVQAGKQDKTALRWIDAAFEARDYTFSDLREKSAQFANVFSSLGIRKSEKIMFLMPQSPEFYFSFLGALKIQANCGLIFANAGEETIRSRIIDTEVKYVICNQSSVDRILNIIASVPFPIVLIVIDSDEFGAGYCGIKTKVEAASEEFQVEFTETSTPSLFHFTSGSTGKPKAVQHVHGSFANQRDSFLEVFQPDETDIYWCTAEPGWVTGTTYGIIAPWINGITQIRYGGAYNAKNWMRILEEHQVTIWYSAPTAFRMLMQNGEDFFKNYDFSRLKRIYSIGEPLNPVIIEWGKKIFDHFIYDTWFQTETGSLLISNRPGVEIRPGSMGKPLSYIETAILDENGNALSSGQEGNLCVKAPWDSMFRTYINHDDVYAEKFKRGYYYSGDIAYQDEDGYIWFIGRNDDIINTAGHLVSPFEVESAILGLPGVDDVGVIGAPDPVLFEKVVAFIKLSPSYKLDKKLCHTIKMSVMNSVSTIAIPQDIVEVDDIPKTESGKLLRRLLKDDYCKKNN